MIAPFDVFRVETDMRLVWKDTAETFELAERRIEILRVAQPGSYMIYSQSTGCKTVVSEKTGRKTAISATSDSVDTPQL